MNLEDKYKKLVDELFNGDKSIAIFVVNGSHYYVIDDKNNFCIDVRPDYKNYVKQGIIPESLYDESLKQFRNGIPILTEDNFHDYIERNNVEVYSSEWMRGFFIAGHDCIEMSSFYNYIERFLVGSNDPVSNEWEGYIIVII